jgi:hypothetical protein
MGADGAGGVAKAGLPQHGQVKQSFDQNHGGVTADRIPSKQVSLGTRQKPVREGGADAAAVEVDDVAVLTK